MTDFETARPKSDSRVSKRESKMPRLSRKSKKSSLKPRKGSAKKSRSTSKVRTRGSVRPSSAPSLRGASLQSSKEKKSWTFPPFGGTAMSRADFSASLKPIWSQSPDIGSFYSKAPKSSIDKRPSSAGRPVKKGFSETQRKRPESAPLQKPSVRAWRRRVRGVLSSSSDFDINIACCIPPEIPNRHPYRNVPAYVDLASFLYPEYFWTLVDHFLCNQEWPRWSTLEPSFQRVCAQFSIDGATTLHMAGFAPLWLNLLRQADEVAFRTVVGHFFFTHKIPPWKILPKYILQMFQNAGICEFDYAK